MLEGELFQLVLLFGVMILQVIIPPIPAELIVISAGHQYGVGLTTAVAGSGLFIGSAMVFMIGQTLNQRFERFFHREKVRRIMVRAKEFETILLWVRILPYNPSDLISYAAGLIRVAPWKFLTITLIVSFVRTLILAGLGNWVTNIKTVMLVISLLIFSWFVGTLIVYGRKGEEGV
ncbi:MAG: VTT domain-containing protein [Proteobacteria bacterium]|nr:VTT domain-containing protein [Pseudomonadota bacterium]MBU1687048.1 VTT domain-containing protein [Pseudomonadota bacterium]